MKELFIEQEKARYKLKLQHVIERVSVSVNNVIICYIKVLLWCFIA